MKIRLAADLQSDSIVDGLGIRTVIWTQGCSHNCPSCHNPETHSFKEGFLVSVEEIKKQIAEVIQALFDVDAHKIKIVKMKGENQ